MNKDVYIKFLEQLVDTQQKLIQIYEKRLENQETSMFIKPNNMNLDDFMKAINEQD